MAGFFETLFGGGAEREAADRNRALYNDYQSRGTGFLQQGYNTGVTNLNNALGAYAPLSNLASQYRGGTDMLFNALGLNGASGGNTAWQAFQQYNPGTAGGLNAGLDAINRRRAATGMLASGNADQDAQVFGQNLQNQQYNNWLQGLMGLNQNALSSTGAVASGQAGVYGGLAELANQNGQNQTNLLGSTTSGLSNANVLQAQGEAAGARNLFGGIMNGLSSLASGGTLNGMGGALSGGMGSALGSMGITYGMPGTAGSNMYGPVRY